MMPRPTGVTIIAVLAFLGAALLVVVALFSLAGGILAPTLAASRMGALAGVGAAVLAIFLLICAAVDIVVGVGLWKLKNWARIITIVLTGIGLLGSVLSIISPFGHVFLFVFLIRRLILAAIYAWILWYLFQPNVKQAFGTTGF